MLRALDEIVWTVNPAKDRLDSLANYLAGWTQDFLQGTGLTCELDLPEVPVSSEWRHHVFLVFKAALRNVVRHARATRVQVTLRIEAGALRLAIADDGRGLPEPAATSAGGERALGGHGLENLRARAAQLGGDLRLSSTPGGGTTVELSAPLPK